MFREPKWYVDTTIKVLKRPDLLIQRVKYNCKRIEGDRRYRRGEFHYPYNIFFIAGMPLSGSTWIKNLLARVPGVYTRPTPMPHDVRYRQDICDSAFSRVPKQGNTLFKTHLNPSKENLDCLKRNGVKKVVVSYRDLRDVSLSAYHRLTTFPRDKKAFNYVDLNAMGKEKGLAHCIESTSRNSQVWMRGWREVIDRNPESYHLVRYEDLRANPKNEFVKILQFYEVKLSDEKIDTIIEEAKGRNNMKKNIKASGVLPWAISSNFRKGKVGGWREEFSPTHIELSKKLLGEDLIKLGYEKDFNWEKDEFHSKSY